MQVQLQVHKSNWSYKARFTRRRGGGWCYLLLTILDTFYKKNTEKKNINLMYLEFWHHFLPNPPPPPSHTPPKLEVLPPLQKCWNPPLTISAPTSLSVWQFSWHYPHKTSCLVMRIMQNYNHTQQFICDIQKILPTFFLKQGNYWDS